MFLNYGIIQLSSHTETPPHHEVVSQIRTGLHFPTFHFAASLRKCERDIQNFRVCFCQSSRRLNPAKAQQESQKFRAETLARCVAH